MPSNDLIFILQAFEQQLNELDSDDPTVATDIRKARHQIRALLANPDSVPEPDEFLVEQLAAVAEHFETEHPVLTEWVSKLSDLFSRIGI
ncbi:DUF4404 family protein [Pleionea sediminis]|uniref:DUF4404 family protein n=1 Tax=Pleionea sediminis TaxID=2569479 RepID=UPI001185DF94|nr:DUF4404 family protein [Pleionea sediminis]